ncbi:MAG: ribonuclease HII [Pseudomonadota bacterium]
MRTVATPARPATGEIGVDEAGRGPMAGPVVAAAVLLPADHRIDGLADSKQIPAGRRELLFDAIQTSASVGIGIACSTRIDAINIRGATLWAMGRAVAALGGKTRDREHAFHVLVDGRDTLPGCALRCHAVIKGDALHESVAAASIIAKVTRDRIMTRFDAVYPAYGFAGHKGYPTVEHRIRVRELGPCPIHRKSFAPVRAALDEMR